MTKSATILLLLALGTACTSISNNTSSAEQSPSQKLEKKIGMVVTANPIASKTGADILRAGIDGL